MKIVSWNVNGLRACVKKGAFFEYLEQEEPDILCLQETKVQPDQLDDHVLNPGHYYSIWHSAERKGYSGVALLSRKKPEHIIEGIGIPEYDKEGRVVGADYGAFVVLGVYFPNGQMNEDRLLYKLNFYQAFFDFCEGFKKEGKQVIVCGDYNTAHKSIDLARPKENEDVSGFLPIEREWLDRVINRYKYLDTFREFNQEPDQYSWWTFRAGARQRNVGWRIDYVFATETLRPFIKDAFIQQAVMGSDHCPVGIELDVKGIC